MRYTALILCGLLAASAPSLPRAQGAEYPVTLIAPGKGPYTFPAGYETPWDRIQIRVTEKMSPNLFVLHGSEGPTRASRRVRRQGHGPLRPDGVLISTPRIGRWPKRLKILTFADGPIRLLVDTHVHSDHTGANASSPGRAH